MHQHIGIAANRTGEVRVILEAEPVVPDVLGGVLGLGHGADRQRTEHLQFRSLRSQLAQFVVALGNRRRARQVELHAKLGSEGGQVLHLLWIRLVVHAVRKRNFTLLALVGNEGRHRAIGQQHEIFNQLIGILAALDEGLERLAVLVEPEADLLRVKVDGAVAKAPRPQLLRDRVDVLHELGPVHLLAGEFELLDVVLALRVGLDQLLRLLVGEATI